VIVITRTECGDPKTLEDAVEKIHPAARVFRSSMILSGLVDAQSSGAIPSERMRPEKVTAFCGIGNPRAFFADVRRWGFNLLAEDAFPDHHVYTGQELDRLAAGARKCGAAALLTTEKDAVKLPADWKPALPVLACAIEAQILGAEEFEKTLLTCLESSKKAN
jgi:tetraacyldisaccharide-1-P 4'-kinase